jgi:hypothetical protein
LPQPLWYTQAVRRIALSLALCLLVPVAGCGYQFVRYSEALGDARRVAIQGLVNETFEPGIDSVVGDALHREFLRRGALEIVEDPDVADLVIAGRVRDVRTRSRSFSSIQFALEYEVVLLLDIQVSRRDGTPVSIDRRALVESELYLASADVEVARTNREEALRRLSTVLAGRVHDALYERIAP